MTKKKNTRRTSSMARSSGIGSFLRKPAGQFTATAVVALIVYLIATFSGGGASAPTMASEISVDQAYESRTVAKYWSPRRSPTR